MQMRSSINGMIRQTKSHSIIASKNLTRLISHSSPFTITGKRVEAHRIKSLKLIFRAPAQSVINRNRIQRVYTKNAYASNSTSNAFLALSTQMIRIIQTIYSNQYSITSPIYKSSLLKMGFSSIKWKSIGQKSASPIQSTWPMRISRTLSTILSKSAERFDVEGPTYPKRNNGLDFKIVFEDKPTIHATRLANWDHKNGLVSSAEPQDTGQQGRLSTTIASAPLRIGWLDGIWAQSNLIGSVTRGDSEFVLGRIMSHLSGRLSGNELFNLMQPILPPRFKLAMQLLKKSGLTVLDRWILDSSNRTISIDHAASINNMTAVFNAPSMIVKPFAGMKLGPKPNDTGTLAPYYHALWNTPGSKIPI